jgi:hypothetical protein
VTAAVDVKRQPPGVRSGREDRGAEQVAVAGVERQVGPVERVCPGGAVHGRGPHRVAGDRGDRGRVRAAPADIADHDRPALVAEREDVVEVPTDDRHRTCRPVADGQADPVDRRQAGREQRGLERGRDLPVLLHEPGRGQGLGHPARGGDGQGHVAFAVTGDGIRRSRTASPTTRPRPQQ